MGVPDALHFVARGSPFAFVTVPATVPALLTALASLVSPVGVDSSTMVYLAAGVAAWTAAGAAATNSRHTTLAAGIRNALTMTAPRSIDVDTDDRRRI